MPTIAIVYCTSFGYPTDALRLAEAILSEQRQNITQCILVPSDGGGFCDHHRRQTRLFQTERRSGTGCGKDIGYALI